MKYFTPGKLMISGEYVVLNGAQSLAIPTGKYGQSLEISINKNNFHQWESYDPTGLWFHASFSHDLSIIIQTNDQKKAFLLQQILKYIQLQKPAIFTQALNFITQLNFNRNWGLGSSSTFIVNLSQWTKINPFDLLAISFKGSGYDIAVGLEQKPLIYQLKKNNQPKKHTDTYYNNYLPSWEIVNFSPNFADKIFFVYLNKKQNSRTEIEKYKNTLPTQKIITEINYISKHLTQVKQLENFEKLLEKHEQILSKILQRPTIKSIFFSDYKGTIKSLGAWGGDFILATRSTQYFINKGYKTIIPLNKIL